RRRGQVRRRGPAGEGAGGATVGTAHQRRQTRRNSSAARQVGRPTDRLAVGEATSRSALPRTPASARRRSRRDDAGGRRPAARRSSPSGRPRTGPHRTSDPRAGWLRGAEPRRKALRPPRRTRTSRARASAREAAPSTRSRRGSLQVAIVIRTLHALGVLATSLYQGLLGAARRRAFGACFGLGSV